jgi:hypothetical protein
MARLLLLRTGVTLAIGLFVSDERSKTTEQIRDAVNSVPKPEIAPPAFDIDQFMNVFDPADLEKPRLLQTLSSP